MMLATLLVCVPLAATLPLEPHPLANVVVSLPRSWTVTEDVANGMLMARRNAAAFLFQFKPGAGRITEEQLLDTMADRFATNRVVRMREAIPGNGHQMLADGVSSAGRIRVGVMAVVASGTAIVSLLAAPPAEFDALGGMQLVIDVMASLKVRGAATPTAAPADKLDVPPPGRALTVADLRGDWSNDDSVISRYVTYRGDPAGFESIAIRDKWSFDGQGGVSNIFNAVTAGRGGARQVNEKKSGTVDLTRNILTLRWNGAPAPSYVVRGWRELPGMTVLLLNGPWWNGQVPADVLADRNKGSNLNSYWVRKVR